jgi:multidrug efflux pump subunit AcrA (membrane-fusion protein)
VRYFLLLITGLMLLAGCSPQESFGDPITEGEPTPIPTAVVPNRPVYQVERGDIIDARSFFGRVSPIISQPLRFTFAGRVIAVHFDRGDLVEEGDVIAELDTAVLEQALEIAQSDLEIAQSLLDNVQSQIVFQTQRAQLTLNLAQLSLDYATAQADTPPTEAQAFEISRLQIERDLAQLALDEVNSVIDPQLQVDVTRAEDRIDDILAQIEQMYLLAPMDGTITSMQIEVGDVVGEFDAVGLVSDETNLEVRDTLASEVVEELVEGMPAQLTVANRPSEAIPGTVLILPAPFGSGDDEFVHIRFDDPSQATDFVVGDRVAINVVVNESLAALWLPLAAIREFNGRNFVVVEEDGAQRRVDVVLGIQGEGRVEILEGVEEGQTVIGQ